MSELQAHFPLALMKDVTLHSGRVGLVIVDEINGFCTPGAGRLAPIAPNAQIDRMVDETDRLARIFSENKWPVLAFLDTHTPGVPEPPYPPHCEKGTGEENFVPKLAWLENDPSVTMLRKDCINGYVGGQREDGGNTVLDWLNDNRLEQVVVVGICTDICVMDFVTTLLSVRNHGLTTHLKDVVVFEKGTATYDAPATHPQAPAHHAGLYFMAARGAVLAASLSLK